VFDIANRPVRQDRVGIHGHLAVRIDYAKTEGVSRHRGALAMGIAAVGIALCFARARAVMLFSFVHTLEKSGKFRIAKHRFRQEYEDRTEAQAKKEFSAGRSHGSANSLPSQRCQLLLRDVCGQG
jgi:hypothetical protein